MNWLIKEEPTHYSFDDLTRDGRTSWTGVRNPLAQKHLQSMREGDRIFFYHTGDEKAVVGVARAAGAPYPGPRRRDGKAVCRRCRSGEENEIAGDAEDNQGRQIIR